MPQRFTSVDDYIGSFSEHVQVVLRELRETVLREVPGGEERISYNMPTVTIEDRAVVHFAGWNDHVSVYPIPVGDRRFQRDIGPYRAGKGTLRFPLGESLPRDLIERQVRFLVAERTR